MVRPSAAAATRSRRSQPRRRGKVEPAVRKLFLLSPAKVSGARAGLLLNPRSTFSLAQAFHQHGLTLGEVFTFASGLYFRGKLTYARQFADDATGAIRVITSNAGLLAPEFQVTPATLRSFGEDDIDETNPRYHEPLRRDARRLAAQIAPDAVVVLLGSIATPKYRDVLLEVFGDQLLFPRDFIGRGDMSRGGLLLRQARAGQELEYIPVRGAVYSGRRAPRLNPER
jgi:hypothetical protein